MSDSTLTKNQRHYRAHKARIAAKRKKRRQEDPEWAEEQRRRAKEYYWTHGRERRPRQLVRRTKTRTLPQIRTVNGREVTLVHIGDVARVANRANKTVRQWIESGVLPQPTYIRPGSGWAQWSTAQLDVIRAAADASGIRETRNTNPFSQEAQSTLANFKKLVHAAWRGPGAQS